MSTIVEQKVKGNVYLYEATGYWDKEKKQARQKRKYLGKKDPVTGELIPRKTDPEYNKDEHLEFLERKIRSLEIKGKKQSQDIRELKNAISHLVSQLKELGMDVELKTCSKT